MTIAKVYSKLRWRARWRRKAVREPHYGLTAMLAPLIINRRPQAVMLTPPHTQSHRYISICTPKVSHAHPQLYPHPQSHTSLTVTPLQLQTQSHKDWHNLRVAHDTVTQLPTLVHSHVIGHPHTIAVTQQPQSHPQSPVRLDSIISHIHIPSPIQSHNTW